MEVILNELSVEDLSGTPNDARQKMDALLQLCKHAKKELHCNGLRLPNANFFQVELVPGYTLNQWLIDPQVSPILRTLFNGLRRYPFLENLNEEQENEYILSEYALHEPNHPSNRKKVVGLADAWLRKALAVSLDSHSVWSSCRIGLAINKEDEQHLVEVYHASSAACINEEFRTWIRKIHLLPLLTHTDVDIWFPTAQFNLSKQAKDDLILMFKNGQHKLIDEIEGLIKEIRIDPMKGTGKPETLKGDLAGWMSRRVTDKHRLVYKLTGEILEIYRCYDHYDDK